jgi:hypothetical protein
MTTTKCSERGCEGEVQAKGLCARHYQAQRRKEKGLVAGPRATRHPDAVRVPVWLEPEEDKALRKRAGSRGLNSYIRRAVRAQLAADAAREGKAVRFGRPA